MDYTLGTLIKVENDIVSLNCINTLGRELLIQVKAPHFSELFDEGPPVSGFVCEVVENESRQVNLKLICRNCASDLPHQPGDTKDVWLSVPDVLDGFYSPEIPKAV
jgi:hypothetical protein